MVSAISSGVAIRLSNTSVLCFLVTSSRPLDIFDSTPPGETQLMRILSFAYSFASQAVMLMMAALDDEYASLIA